mgnify:CR=1 FL=1
MNKIKALKKTIDTRYKQKRINAKRIKKEMLRKIVLQKEINESIAKELDIKKD